MIQPNCFRGGSELLTSCILYPVFTGTLSSQLFGLFLLRTGHVLVTLPRLKNYFMVFCRFVSLASLSVCMQVRLIPNSLLTARFNPISLLSYYHSSYFLLSFSLQRDSYGWLNNIGVACISFSLSVSSSLLLF